MRRIVLSILALVVIFSLYGCGKSENVKRVEQCIADIGEVTLLSGKDIEMAETLYSALTPKEQEQVEGYLDLVVARSEFDELDKKKFVGKWCTTAKGTVYELTLYESGTGSYTWTDGIKSTVKWTQDGNTMALVMTSLISGVQYTFDWGFVIDVTQDPMVLIQQNSQQNIWQKVS